MTVPLVSVSQAGWERPATQWRAGNNYRNSIVGRRIALRDSTAGAAQAASKGGGAMAGINLIVLMLLAGLKLFITRSASQD